MTKDLIVAVDVANVLFSNAASKARVKNFYLLHDAIKKRLPLAKIIAIVDASIRYKVDDKDVYEQLIIKENIIQAPAGEPADYYLIQYALIRRNCIIITQDQFKEYEINAELRKRLIPVVFIDDEVFFSKKLDNFLQSSKSSCYFYSNIVSTLVV